MELRQLTSGVEAFGEQLAALLLCELRRPVLPAHERVRVVGRRLPAVAKAEKIVKVIKISYCQS
ncbi:hypothetical protein [Streptomyces sp. NPDC001226]